MTSKPIRSSIDVFCLYQGLEKKCAAIGDIEFKSPNITGLWLNINASHIVVGWGNYEGIRQRPVKGGSTQYRCCCMALQHRNHRIPKMPRVLNPSCMLVWFITHFSAFLLWTLLIYLSVPNPTLAFLDS